MSATTGLKVSVLIRIGDGTPTEVADVDVPLRAALVPDNVFGTAYIEVDHHMLHLRVRDALHEVADRIFTDDPESTE